MYKIKKNRTIIIKKRKKQKISLTKFLNYYMKKYRKIPKKFPVSFDERNINDTVLEINLETDKKNIKIYNSLKNFKYLEKNKTMAIIMDSDHEITMTNLIRIGTFSYADRDEPYIRWETKYSRKYKKYIYNYHNNKQNLKQYLEEYTAKEIEKLLNDED